MPIHDHVLGCCGQPLVDDLGCPRITDAQNDVWLIRGRPSVDAQQRVGVGDGAGMLETRAAAGIGQYRPTERCGQPVDRRRIIDAAPGHEDSTATAQPADEVRDHGGRERGRVNRREHQSQRVIVHRG